MDRDDKILTVNKDRFLSIVKEKIHREGISDLMAWLEGTDFFVAPASTKYHECYEGGLVEHSLNVYDHLLLLDQAYHTALYDESMAICALFHDLCKVNCYSVSERNVKGEDGVWRKEPFYKWDEQEKYGGHGSKSVFLVQYFMKLYFNEASAINCHMGIENGNCNPIYDAFRVNSLAFLLHVADAASTCDSLDISFFRESFLK